MKTVFIYRNDKHYVMHYRYQNNCSDISQPAHSNLTISHLKEPFHLKKTTSLSEFSRNAQHPVAPSTAQFNINTGNLYVKHKLSIHKHKSFYILYLFNSRKIKIKDSFILLQSTHQKPIYEKKVTGTQWPTFSLKPFCIQLIHNLTNFKIKCLQ